MQNVKLIRDKLKGQPVGKCEESIQNHLNSVIVANLGYGFVEFPNHDIAKNVFMTLNGTQI